MARLTLCPTERHLLILLRKLRRLHNIETPLICATSFSTKNPAKMTIRMKVDFSILLDFGVPVVSLFNSRFTNEKMLCDRDQDFPNFMYPLQLRYFDDVFLLMSSSCSHSRPLCFFFLFSNRAWKLIDVHFG